MSNTTAQSHPFIVGRRTFARYFDASAYASRTAQNTRCATSVMDRRDGTRVASFPVGIVMSRAGS